MPDILDLIGERTIPNNVQRDSIHIAILPGIAGEDLNPGDHVSLQNGRFFKHGHRIGIVDPFSQYNYWETNNNVLVMLYPRTVTNLRHVWEHPLIPNEESNAERTPLRSEDEAWLRAFSETHNVTFENLIRQAEESRGLFEDTEWWVIYGEDAHGAIPNEFWDRLERYLGRTFPHRPSYFSCSC